MYLQLTTRCNKKCGHCCYSCTEEGEDMTKEVFIAACELFQGDCISLGGGEPTLHPLFWEFIGLALRYCEGDQHGSVWLATNGSMVKDTLQLSRLARTGVIAVTLSVDKWHGHVDPKVVEAFTRGQTFCSGYSYEERNPYDMREIRSIEQPSASGRAAEWGEPGRCACDDIFVRPSGELFACGCQTKRLGTVFAPKLPRNFERVCHGVERAKRKARAA